MVYRFCSQLDRLIKESKYRDYEIYHYCSVDPAKRANAAFLMGAFQIVILKKTANEAWRPFATLPTFLAFRDASYGPCYYECTILHCLRGLERGIRLGWFDYLRFDLTFTECYEKIENGDINWIIPSKLLAFSCPAERKDSGLNNLTPEEYSVLFKKLGVSAVIRLNNKTYDESRFIRNGIKHYELFFVDGSCPSDDIVARFNSIVEMESGAVAVHCKAGLGRTGSLIGCYAIKNYHFPAEDFIGWARICRPGSVLGPQQPFLAEYEMKINRNYSVRDITNQMSTLSVEYSPSDRYKAQFGDQGQAQRLLSAKIAHRTPQSSPTPYKDRPRPSTPGYDRPVFSKDINRDDTNGYSRAEIQRETVTSRSPFYPRRAFQSSRDNLSPYSPVHINNGYRN